MLRKWDIDNPELNKKCLDEVITYVQDIKDPDNVGIITAQEIIDIVIENYAPHIHNKALDSAKKVISEKMQDIEYAVDELRQL